MFYSLNSIQTVEDCDTILTTFGKIKSNLMVRKMSIERQIETANVQGIAWPARKVYLENWMPAMTTYAEGLPEGNEKKLITMSLNDADDELRALNEKMIKLKPEDYLLREQKLQYTIDEITEVTNLIDGVTVRKSEIQTSTPSAA